MSNIIEVENISMSYKIVEGGTQSIKEFAIKLVSKKLKKTTHEVLKNVSFTVKKGEILGIIGVNGAGKSTLLAIISGVLSPNNGKVICRGKISPLLGLGSGFDSELTGVENIYLNAAVLGYSKKEIDSKFQKIIEFSELGKFLYQPIRTYSRGMLARLGFSIAAELEPEILIIDEVLGVGDAHFREKSTKRIVELMQSGATVLLVSHNLETIKKYCNRALWLEKGEIRMIGESINVVNEYEKNIKLLNITKGAVQIKK